ncbi:RNA-binding protein [Perkinsela sp. CCAP 1560/4]|nr:RNA-binding protein [Perkinsela sp. CCAP 1560/4]|eukprot:KNH04188.1 RNA-binding protein [Perkinsela sp. CCAP 1560/4]
MCFQDTRARSSNSLLIPVKICVRNLPSGITEDEVRNFFSSCGEVVDIFLKDNGPNTFGFVGFDNVPSQQQALAFDARNFNDMTIKLEAKRIFGAAGGRGDRDANKVFVGGLTMETPDDEVREYFEKSVGTVTDFYRARNGVFAFVGFSNNDDKNAAIAKTGSDIGGYGDSYPPRRFDDRSPPSRRYRDEEEEAPRYRRRSRSLPPRRGRDYSPSRSPETRRRILRSPASTFCNGSLTCLDWKWIIPMPKIEASPSRRNTSAFYDDHGLPSGRYLQEAGSTRNTSKTSGWHQADQDETPHSCPPP